MYAMKGDVCHEITANEMLGMLRARAEYLDMELRRAMERNDWINRGVNCPRHPANGGDCRFHAVSGNCDDIRRKKIDRFIESVRDAWTPDELLGKRDMVQPGKLPARGNGRQGNIDGKRKATG